MLLATLAEMVTIGAALPLLGLIANRDTTLSARIQPMLDVVGSKPLVAAALLLMAAAATANLLRLAVTWFVQKTVAGVAADLSIALYSRMIRQPYSAQLHRSSSELLAAAEKVQTVAFHLIFPVMQGAVAAGMAAGISIVLFVINLEAAALAVGTFLLAYLLMEALSRKRLLMDSATEARSNTDRHRLLRESIGGARDIILDRSQPYFEDRFERVERRFRRVQARMAFIASIPRYLMEIIGIGCLALVAFVIAARDGDLAAGLPALGVLALGAQRLLPLMQHAWLGLAQSRSNHGNLVDILALTSAPLPDLPDTASGGANTISFEREIVFANVSFSYLGGPPVLDDVCLSIAKGETVGIAGPTGAGKSTLVNLLMGLLQPVKGEVRIDGRPLTADTSPAWHRSLAHVPQSIHIADDSIAANICFGVATGEYDAERIAAAARGAMAAGFIEAFSDGYATKLGEQGVRLSGGQEQRVGIARALYRRRPLLILDEATSALDPAVEEEILRSLATMPVTRIIVSHRQSTLAHCGRVLWVEGGRVTELQSTRLG